MGKNVSNNSFIPTPINKMGHGKFLIKKFLGPEWYVTQGIQVLRIAEQLAAPSRKGDSGGHEARILLRTLDIPGHVDFYVRDA